MIDLFIPDVSQVPTEQERVNRLAEDIIHIADDRMIHFDTDIVIIIALIVESLSGAGFLERDKLIQPLESLYEDRKAKWAAGHSPLVSLANILKAMSRREEPSAVRSASWLREVIEGGLSEKVENEPAD